MSKQTLTTMSRALERDGLIERRCDPADARATQMIFLATRARELEPIAERILAGLDHRVAAATGVSSRASLKQALRTLVDF